MGNPIWSYIFKKDEKAENPMDALRKVPIFDTLNALEVKVVEKLLHVRHYNRGEIIFTQDEPGIGLYIIREGSVKIAKTEKDGTEKKLAELFPGQFFGELSLLDDAPRSANAIALEPCILFGFFHPDLMSLVGRKPALGCKILFRLAQLLGDRLIKTNQRLQ